MKKIMKQYLMNNVQLFAFVDDAKLRREFEENKKTAEILMKLMRQSPDIATKRGNRAQSCPKRQ